MVSTVVWSQWDGLVRSKWAVPSRAGAPSDGHNVQEGAKMTSTMNGTVEETVRKIVRDDLAEFYKKEF